MRRVGFIGWRGMVGSVLMGRMNEEKDFSVIDPAFFTSQMSEARGRTSVKTFRRSRMHGISVTCRQWKSSYPARVATTPVIFIPNCAVQDGRDIGSMQLLRCA